jgi:cytochrome P450
MSDEQPVPTGRQLSALDPVFCERPHEYLDQLRAEDPVHRDAEAGRFSLTRFEDVKLSCRTDRSPLIRAKRRKIRIIGAT